MSKILKRILGFGLVAAIAVWFGAVTTACAGTMPVYAGGHCDLCADYEDDAMSLHYHFHPESPGTAEGGASLVGEYEPSTLYTRVSDATRTTMPSNSAYSFIGGAAGSNVWILSQNNVVGQPYLGFGTEELYGSATQLELEGLTEGVYFPNGVTYSLKSVSGPGQFSMWMNGSFGSPIVYWATSDGINSSDVYTQAALGHSHANWGFTTEGVYAVEMQISGDVMEYKEGVSTGPTTVYSDVETFTFLVGSSTVPEPGAIAMLSSAAVGLALSFWNRRRNTAMRV